MNEKAKLISVGELFRQSWSIYRERFQVILGIFAVPIILVALGTILSEANISKTAGDIISFIGGIIYFIAELAFIYQLRDQAGANDSYRNAFRNILPYIWLTILPGLIILGGFVMFIVPGIIFIIWLLFPLYVFVFENQRGMNAVLRSKEYIQGNWWQVFGRILALFVAILIIYYLPVALTSDSVVISNGIAGLLELIFVPVSIIYFYLMYQSSKQMKTELAGQPPTGPRGFFYFSAIMGIVGIVLLVLVATYLSSAITEGLPNTSGLPE